MEPIASQKRALQQEYGFPHSPVGIVVVAAFFLVSTCCGKGLCGCPMGEESWLGGFGKGPIAEREFGSSGRSRPRKRVYRHSNALRMSQGRFLHPSDIGPNGPFPQQVLVSLGTQAMLDPDRVPKGAEFEYFAESPAMIGVPGHVAWVDRFGSVWSEDAELLFFLGEELRPYALSAKKLADNRLPHVSATCSAGGCRYEFVSFSSQVPEVDRISCLHFISVVVANSTARIQPCPLAVACRCRTDEGNVAMFSAGCYRFQEDKALLNDRILYVGSPGGEPFSVHGVPYGGPFTATSLQVLPSTPVLWRVYRPVLEPGERRHFHFILPSPAISLQEPKLVSLLDMLQPEAYEERVLSRWNDFLDAGARFRLEEEKICQSLDSNIIYGYLLDSLPAFQLEDPADLGSIWISCLGAIALDVTGHFEEAKTILMGLMSHCNSRTPTPVDPQALIERCQISWAMGVHTSVTRDMGFARTALELLEQCTEGVDLEQRELDSRVAPWLALASREAAWLSDFIGEPQLAGRFHVFSGQSSAAPEFNGEGNVHEWLLPLALGVVDPAANKVTSSVNALRERYMAEGILVSKQGDLLPASTAMLALTHLARGEEKFALDAFYSMLLHTSTSHIGVDGGVEAWGTRTTPFPVPFRAFSHLIVLLTRCMMVREEESSLHLLSCVSPQWMSPGSTIELRNMPTRFGPLHLSVKSKRNSGSILLETAFFEDPTEVFLHVPWFLRLRSARSNGRRARKLGKALVLKPESQEIKLRWDRQAMTTGWDEAVQRYELEYKSRFQRFQEERGAVFVPRPAPLLNLQQRTDQYRMMCPSAWQNLASIKKVLVGQEKEEIVSPKVLWDGNREGVAWTSGTCPQWVLFELDRVFLLEAVRFHMPDTVKIQCRYDLFLSPNGRDWHAAAKGIQQDSERTPSLLTVFPPRQARFVRITLDEAKPGDAVPVTEIELVKVCPERPHALVHNCALGSTIRDANLKTYPNLVNGSLLQSEAVSAESIQDGVIDLQSVRTVCGVGVWYCAFTQDLKLNLKVSSDGQDWRPAGTLNLTPKANFLAISFPELAGRYVKIEAPSEPLRFMEWEVYCCPQR